MAEHHHDLTTDLEDHLVVDADLTLLNRVVSNLFENELTHLPTGCQVKIRLHSHQGSAVLVVEDNGPGFPRRYQRPGFQTIRKGQTLSRSRSGTSVRRCSCPGAWWWHAGFGSSGRRRGYHLIATRQLAPGGVGFARCSMLKQFVAHVGPKFLCYVEEVITAICCPHLFAVFPNDRSAAG